MVFKCLKLICIYIFWPYMHCIYILRYVVEQVFYTAEHHFERLMFRRLTSILALFLLLDPNSSLYIKPKVSVISNKCSTYSVFESCIYSVADSFENCGVLVALCFRPRRVCKQGVCQGICESRNKIPCTCSKGSNLGAWS